VSGHVRKYGAEKAIVLISNFLKNYGKLKNPTC
jgi:hypothetical protein